MSVGLGPSPTLGKHRESDSTALFTLVLTGKFRTLMIPSVSPVLQFNGINFLLSYTLNSFSLLFITIYENACS